MKEKIESLLRHALTALPAVDGFFVGKGWLTGEEGAAVDAAVTDFLSVLCAIVAAGLARLVMWLVAKYFPSLSGLLGGAKSGGISPALLLMCTAAAFTVVALPSCSQAQLAAFKEIPVTIGIEGDHGTYTYNHEDGVGVVVKVREEKSFERGGERKCPTPRWEELVLWDPRRPYRPQRLCLDDLPDLDLRSLVIQREGGCPPCSASPVNSPAIP